MAEKRLYIVEQTEPPAEGQKAPLPRIVETTHPSIARSHVAQTAYTVRVATPKEAFDLGQKGVAIEQVGQEQQSLLGSDPNG